MKRMLFLVNPYAGRGRFVNSVPAVMKQFRKAEYEVTVYPTQKTGDGETKIQEEGCSYDRIVVAGGDGMLHEVVNAVLKLPKPIVIGYIPTGTVNDFGATYGLPLIPEKAAEIAASDELQWIDSGEFNNCIFSYVAAFGVATQAAYRTDQKAKNRFGRLAYIMNALQYMIPSRLDEASTQMVIKYENTLLTGDFIFGAISNSLSIAGMNNLIGDDVVLDDGLLEGIFIRKPRTVTGLFSILLKILLHDLNSPDIFQIQANRITIHSQPTAWTLDGEDGGVWENAEIQAIKRGVHLAAPAK